MQNALFYGCATALVTPFRGDRVDYDAFERLIDRQLAAHIDALVVLGTTGEPSTIAEAERAAILECARSRCLSDVPLIAGTGANDTRHAVRRAQAAERLGADALLVVTPYYNKASRAGLIAHYTAIADSVSIPVIMYNVPGRTGMNMEPEIVAELARHPNLRGVKEASGSLRQMTGLAACSEGMAVYCGNDDQIVPAMALGARGAISVAANVIPEHMRELTACCLSGDYKRALRLQSECLPLIRALFCEVNPIPVKAALSMLGLCDNALRLPLAPLAEEHAPELRRALEALGLL